jgi:L-threonylcarbamoyladenylate synthase
MDPVERAAEIIRHDGLVVYPTDTIYGLGADALSDEAILKVYEAKRRPLSMPVSIAACSLDMIHGVAIVDEIACQFIECFLPGPVTVVLPARNCIPEILTGGTGMIGIRIPAHPVAISLIERLDCPITATSANISGGRDPVVPSECHVHYDFLIDGGRLPGTPSTVVDIGKRAVLRRGAMADAVDAHLESLR